MAASFPVATAPMTVSGPETASPPAKTPSIFVCSVKSSTIIVPNRVYSSLSGSISWFTRWPIAMITVSTSMVNSEPSIGTGRLRPLSSGSPSSIRMHSMPVTFPFWERTLTGFTSILIAMPSTSASSTSVLSAGISVRERRYTMATSLAPMRLATLAASIAALPPPITATRFPILTFSPEFARCRKLRAFSTPSASSPGIPIVWPIPAPAAMNTAL